MPVGDSIFQYILSVITNSRPETSNIKIVKENILWGPSPRASLALLLACKAKAFLDNKMSPSVFDVRKLIKPILNHRINLSITAKADNVKVDEILDEVIEKAND